MATVLLLRHTRSTANGAGLLAGRTPRVGLDDTGRAQAAALVDRLDGIPIVDVVRSPSLRCRQTVAPLVAARGLRARTDARLAEVDYGEWTGGKLADLAKQPLWKVVQGHPSAAVFPGGEAMAAVQARAVAAIRAHDARVTAEHGADAIWLACSHGDPISMVLADALGMHLDSFQRIVVEPGSISVVRYTDMRPFVLRCNDNSSALGSIVPAKPKRRRSRKRSADATVGGAV